MAQETDILDDPEVATALAAIFCLLIKSHGELCGRQADHAVIPQAERFRQLIEAFKALNLRIEVEDRVESVEITTKYDRIISLFRAAREQLRLRQEETAEDFNLLEVMQIVHKEIRHSMVLAWLLDDDLARSGTHAQGTLGFRLFLQEFSNDFGWNIGYADFPYWVRREVSGDESIVDIEVGSQGKFLIHIENKIGATEGADQTNREWEDIKRRARNIGIDPSKAYAPVYALYLTPNGTKPTNPNFKAISWRRAINVFDAFSALAKPPDVKLFAAHYAQALVKFLSRFGQ